MSLIMKNNRTTLSEIQKVLYIQCDRSISCCDSASGIKVQIINIESEKGSELCCDPSTECCTSVNKTYTSAPQPSPLLRWDFVKAICSFKMILKQVESSGKINSSTTLIVIILFVFSIFDVRGQNQESILINELR